MENQPLLNNDYEKKGAFHPTGVAFRYGLLFIISLICFGSYFTYDEIQPAQYRNAFNSYITDDNFGILYSVYSIPNTILVFFGGILGDKIGLRLAGLIFVVLCCIGSVVVAIASTLIGSNNHGISPHQAFLLTIIGRVIFGCGAESLNVIQNSMITRWFSGGRELAFAMGLVLSMSRLGDLFALSGTVYVYNFFDHNYNYVLWLGAILCGVSLLCVIIYSVVDKATEKYFPNRTFNPEENALNFRAVLSFDLRFWLIAVICMSYYGGIFPFIAICSDFLVRVYGLGTIDADGNSEPDELASILSGVITLSSLVLSPFLGKFLDVVARRPYFVMFGSMAVIPAHLWLALHIKFPVIPFVIMGLSFSLVPSALWPSIPLVVKSSEVATAFGVMAAVQNSGLALINFVSGKLAHAYGYGITMYFFVLMDSIGLIFAIMLVIVDRSRGGLLINPKKKEESVDAIPTASTGESQGGVINY